MLPDSASSICGRCRLRVFVEGGAHGHDESGRAEAALLSVVLHEGGRHGVELAAVDETLGGLDLFALGLQREHGAGVDGFAVHHDGAGAASAAIADALAAGDIEIIAQGVEQRNARLDGGGHGGAVDVEPKLDRLRPDGLGGALGRRVLGSRRRRFGENGGSSGGGAGRAQEIAPRQARFVGCVPGCCSSVGTLPLHGWDEDNPWIARTRWRCEDSKGGEGREQANCEFFMAAQLPAGD